LVIRAGRDEENEENDLAAFLLQASSAMPRSKGLTCGQVGLVNHAEALTVTDSELYFCLQVPKHVRR
jgi:hypothetical protein